MPTPALHTHFNVCHVQASDWEVEAAVHLLDAFHTVKGPPLEELAQVCPAISPLC